VQVLEALNLRCVRAVAVGPRRLENCGQALQPRVREEDAEPLAHEPGADVRMAIAVRAERRSGVVHVQAAQPVEADLCLHLGDCLVEDSRIGDVDPRDPEVAGVEAESEPRMPVEPVDEGGELGDGAAHGAARAG
jgi:hypothetical protein